MRRSLPDDPPPSEVLARLAAAHKAWNHREARCRRGMREQLACLMSLRRCFAPERQPGHWHRAPADLEDLL